MASRVLIVGGHGEVGRRLASELEAAEAGRVILGGRHARSTLGLPAIRIDVDDPGTFAPALEDVGLACVRQREPHLLRAALERGIAYTSIAPPWIPWAETRPLHERAQRTGARLVLAAGIEPGITSVLARASADRLGGVDAIESALLLSLGDAYGADSMAFIFEEVVEPYAIRVDSREGPAHAFERPRSVRFPPPLGLRRAYAMPFRDQLYYPFTLGAKTAIARIALDPPWLARGLAVLLPLGLRKLLRRGSSGAVRELIGKLRARYEGRDGYGLVVEVRRGRRMIRSSIVGTQQAQATAIGVAAIAEALWRGEVDPPGVWLAEQVIDPARFLARIGRRGIVPVVEDAAC